MGSEQFANGVHAIARHEGWIFSRAKKRVTVEQKDAILAPFDDGLNQHGVVVLRHLIEVADKRPLAVNGLREIAARSRERLDEGRAAQSTEIRYRVAALMARADSFQPAG